MSLINLLLNKKKLIKNFKFKLIILVNNFYFHFTINNMNFYFIGYNL